MITLLTAVPGAGKTAYAVQYLLEEKSLEGRPIYSNITGLKLPHFPIDAEWMQNWYKNAPPGAFILFDECQDVFPPRHVSREAPEFVQLLAKHRKDYSVDIFLITQGANLIDFAVRAQVERYLHIRMDGLLPMIHEAREVVDFKDKAVRETHTGTPYKPPKKVFDLYVSSQIHNKKPRRKLPTAVYIFGLAFLIAVGLAVYVYQTRFADDSIVAEVADGGGQGDGSPSPLPSMAALPLNVVPERITEALMPADDHNPLSAPLYAAVVPPVVAPEIVGCISSRKSCTCYSQQQTPVWLPEPQCRERAAGLYYDPYRQPMQLERTTAETKPRTAAGEAATATGVQPARDEQNPSAML